jgi:hypothetical protein
MTLHVMKKKKLQFLCCSYWCVCMTFNIIIIIIIITYTHRTSQQERGLL